MEWVFPLSYAKKKYNWKALSSKKWWQENIKEVAPDVFYKTIDQKITDYCWGE